MELMRSLINKASFREDRLSGINVLYLCFTIIITLVSSIVLFSKHEDPYGLIFILPLIFLLGQILFFLIRANLLSGLGSFFLNLMFFIHMVATPVIMSAGNWGSKTSFFIYGDFVPSAILLMAYEYAAVSIVMILYHWKRKPQSMITLREKPVGDISYGELTAEYRSAFRTTVYIMTLAFLLCMLIFPNLNSYFNLYFASGSASHINRVLMILNMPGGVYYPFKILTELLRVLGPILAATLVYKLRISDNIKIATMFLLVVLVFGITTGEQITSFKIILVLIALTLTMYPRFAKPMLAIGLLGCVVVVIFGVATQMSVKSPTRLSAVFQSYFGGPSNVALGLKAGAQGRNFILADFLRGLPLLSTFFKDQMTSAEMFNRLSDYISTGNEIMPFIAASANYLSAYLAPLPEMALALATLFVDDLFRKRTDILGKYIYGYIALSLALTPVMYSPQILYSQLFSMLLPLTVLLYINSGNGIRLGMGNRKIR